jgi:hypothetical protein
MRCSEPTRSMLLNPASIIPSSTLSTATLVWAATRMRGVRLRALSCLLLLPPDACRCRKRSSAAAGV